MKKYVLFLVAALALLLSACGGPASSEPSDVPSGSAPVVSTPAENEPPAVIPAENSKPPEAPETGMSFEFDALQNCFISISENTTIDDILAFVEENALFYSENEVTIDKTVYYIIAYEEGVTRPRYADSGDYINVSFDRANGDTIQHAQYVKSDSYDCSALFYNYGTWYNFRDQNAVDYSGYYNVKGSIFDADGIVVK